MKIKKSRNIRWSKSAGAKQENTSLFGKESSSLGELSLFVLCTLLFFGSACGMLESVYEWDIFSAGIVIRVLLVTLLVSVLVELTGKLKPRLGGLAKLGIGVMGLFFFFLYLRNSEKGTAVWDGLCAVANRFLNDWNTYYRMSGRFRVGDVDEIVPALEFGVTLLCFLFVWLASVWKKVWLPGLVPCLILAAELLIGSSPEGISLWALVIGVCAANGAGVRNAEFLSIADRLGEDRNGLRRQFVWLPSAVFVILLCIAVSVAGTTSANETVENGRNKLEQQKEETLQKIADWTGWQEVSVAKSVEKAIEEFLHKKDIKTKNRPEANFARLDNRKPEYRDEAVLKVIVDGWQRYGAYLIGFYAGNYEDGVWDTDVEAFERACKKAGFEPETVTEKLFSLGVDRMAERYGDELSLESGEGKNTGVVQYAKAKLIKTYLPYFAKTTAEGVRAEGDSRYVKEKEVTKVPFSFWNYKVDELVTMVHLVEKMKTDVWKEPWELWYEDYVAEHYLKVPGNFTQVKKVAEEVRNWEAEFFRLEGDFAVNIDRLNRAYQVADWMRNNTVYSLELPELPEGSDPIEYFLGTSRTGYCMHYASASVMILRELGVPARYVSGYVAGRFERNQDTLKYEAVVLDSAAHAWVEIYLEGFGWVPVEVTNGYSVLAERTQVFESREDGGVSISQEKWPDSKEEGWVDIMPFATPKPTPTPGPTPTPVPNSTSVPSGNQSAESKEQGESSESHTGGATGPGEENQQVQKTEEGNDDKKEFFAVRNYILFGIPILLIAAFVLYRVYLSTSCSAQERRLNKRKHAGNRRQIKQWNRLLYRKLRAKGKFRKRAVSDEEYEEVLKSYTKVLSLEEVRRYMYLAKAAAFSQNEFNDEEVWFCKTVYRKVLYEEGKNDSAGK
ncbi:MAG: transglutaminase domain-containing protein [Lachnospiraceae bacterium]|nr:transglutaminase domain-containing protein [Lachnospiraceae bacterium]